MATEVVKLLLKHDKMSKGVRVLVLGFSFKENVPDCRNTKVWELICHLREFGIEPVVVDPLVDKATAWEEYGLRIEEDPAFYAPYSAVILAVKHEPFKELFPLKRLKELSSTQPILYDIKSFYNKEEALKLGFVYIRL